MIKKITLGLALATSISIPAFAQEYQYELGLSYYSGDSFNTDFDGVTFEGTAHFSKVDTSHGPLSEASFLDKSSYVTLTLNAETFDIEDASGDTHSDTNNSLFSRFYANEVVIFEATVRKLRFAGENDYETVLKAGVGFYANDTTDVVFSVENFDHADQLALSVDSHGVYSVFGDMSIAYDAGIAFLDTKADKGTRVNAAVTFYPINSLGMGVSLTRVSVDDLLASRASVYVDYFVIDSLELNLAFTSEGIDAERDEVTIGAAFRF